MQISKCLAIIAGIVYILGYVLYNRNFFKGTTKPKIATWAIWTVESFIFTESYTVASDDDWESIIPKINVLLCSITFLLTFIVGEFKMPKKREWFALGVVLASVLIWKISGSAEYANYIAQLAIAIGFIPTWEGIWHTPSNEATLPWRLWTVSYVIALLVAILRWKGQCVDVVYPAVCVVLHVSVPIICTFRNRAQIEFQAQISELNA